MPLNRSSSETFAQNMLQQLKMTLTLNTRGHPPVLISNFSSSSFFPLFVLPLQPWAELRMWRSTWAWWPWPCVWPCCLLWSSWSTGARRKAWMPTWPTPPSSPLASSPWASSPASQVCGRRGHAGLPPTAVGHCSLFCFRLSVFATVTVPHSSTCTTGAVCLWLWRWREFVFSGLWSKRDLLCCVCVVHELFICLPDTLCFASTLLSGNVPTLFTACVEPQRFNSE